MESHVGRKCEIMKLWKAILGEDGKFGWLVIIKYPTCRHLYTHAIIYLNITIVNSIAIVICTPKKLQ